jgi:hypothetical protein
VGARALLDERARESGDRGEGGSNQEPEMRERD